MFPAYARALGLVGRLTIGDLETLGPARVESLWQSLPLVRIRPPTSPRSAVATGPDLSGVAVAAIAVA